MKKLVFIILATLIPLSIVWASIGVGISAPIFRLGQVKPKKLYNVGTAVVTNSGTEYGCYKMNVAYFHNQPEKRIPSQWVIFNPEEFCLNPLSTSGDYKRVDIKLFIEPKYKIDDGLKGDYFSFLEACTYLGYLGACAATKLYFTVN